VTIKDALDDDSVGSPMQAAQRSFTPSKTPAYQAMHAHRYRRQDLIRAVEEATQRRLICYVGGLRTGISRDDVLFLVDLLHNVRPNEGLDLLLHTGGGDMDAAEKLISMIRTHVGAAELRVVIPDFAKSAGTLMALGADYIVMSNSSELGPIDPQIVLNDGQGNFVPTPIQSYLDAFDQFSAALKKDPGDVAARIMLEKLDPARLKVFQTARQRARTFAEDRLKRGMFKSPRIGNHTKIASELLDTTKWLSHGQLIDHEDAKEIGLHVEYLEPTNDTWQRYWQLYCHQRLEIKERQKLFESSYASLILDEAS
jgi:Serine dehydrogenase proteinase